jgi:glutathione S-transferase
VIQGYAPERIEYGVNRYQNETRRLYRVMDTQLAKTKKFLVPGDKLTIADISCWGWVASHSEFQPPTLPTSLSPPSNVGTRRKKPGPA